MVSLRQSALCCAAIVLLLGGLSSLAATIGTVDAPGAEAPCHTAHPAPALHDQDCAMGCQSAPGPVWPEPDWAPAAGRGGDEDRPDATATAPERGSLSPPLFRDSAPQGDHAQPALPCATPVARHDVLRD